MALAYDAARVTRDVDARFVPHGIVATRPGRWPGTWACRPGGSTSRQLPTSPAYISGKDDPGKRLVFDHPGLRVMAASPEHVFAMKALARVRLDPLHLLGASTATGQGIRIG